MNNNTIRDNVKDAIRETIVQKDVDEDLDDMVANIADAVFVSLNITEAEQDFPVSKYSVIVWEDD